MKILKNIEIIDLALKIGKTLIISDIHIGYEESLNKQGVLIPRQQFQELIKRLEKIFQKTKKLEKIIVNGDLKHEFGTISDQEWRNILKFIDFLKKHCNELVLIKGNHDAILEPIAKKRQVTVVKHHIIAPSEKLRLPSKSSMLHSARREIAKRVFLMERQKEENILVTHGDSIPNKEILKQANTIVIGHEHPAISLENETRKETFKCYLLGKYKRKNLIVQPSFNTLVEGTDVLQGRMLSPFLKQKLDNFEVFVVEDKVYWFGKVGDLE